MTRIPMGTWIAWGLGIVLLAASARPLWAAGTYHGGVPSAPCCSPNVSGFGYFAAKWRQWPGEPRLDQQFPEAVGRTPLPVPVPTVGRPPVLEKLEAVPPPLAEPPMPPSAPEPKPSPPPSPPMPKAQPPMPKAQPPKPPAAVAPPSPKAGGSPPDLREPKAPAPTPPPPPVTFQPWQDRDAAPPQRPQPLEPPAPGDESVRRASHLVGSDPPGKTALDGFCPVELIQNEGWVPGDVRYAVVHKGQTYRLAGPAQQRQFLANPDRYVPALSGMDPVASVEDRRQAAGQTDFCVVYDGRLYMFSTPENLARFRQDPKRYATLIQRPAR